MVRPSIEDLVIIYAVLTPTAVLYWHTTAILLNEWVGKNLIKLIVGFWSAAAIAYYHDTFRNSAPTSSYVARTTYETTYDYMVRLSCRCYHHGCRLFYDILIATGILGPIHVAIIAAVVLIYFRGFRKVLGFPMNVSEDESVERYRPPSTLTFHEGTLLIV